MTFEERLSAFRDEINGRDFVVNVEAGRFVEMMTREHPGELVEWMRTHAARVVADRLGDMERRERDVAVRRAKARAFGRSVEEGEVGLFRVTFTVDDDFTRRPLGAMRRADCEFVAASYESNGNYHLSMAAFLRAVGKKAGRRTVGEALGEAECERLLRSFLPANAELPLAA